MVRKYRRYRKKPYGKKLNKVQVKQVKQIALADVERKYCLDVEQNLSATTAPAFYDVTSTITQGNTDSLRIGNSVTMKQMKFRFFADAKAGTLSDAYNRVRVFVFQWHMDSISPPSQGSPTRAVLDITGGFPYMTGPFNYDNRDKYTILYDKTVQLAPIWSFNSSGTVVSSHAQSAGYVSPMININLKKARKTLHYDGISSTGTNHIYVGIASDSSVSPHPAVSFYSMITYIDQ